MGPGRELRHKPVHFSRITLLIFLIIAMALHCGCGANKTDRSQKPLIRISLLFSEGSLFYKTAEEWAERVGEASKGRLNLTVCPGGELLARSGKGSQVELLKSGDAEIAFIRPAELTSLNPDFKIIYLPFFFPNRRAADAFLRGDTAGKMLARLRENGIVGLGYLSGPFFQLSSRRRIISPAEMGGVRLRLSQARSTAMDRKAMKLLGVRVVQSPAVSLKREIKGGKIDGQLSTLEFFDKMDLGEQQPYMMFVNYSFEPMAVCASQTFLDELNAADRELLLETLRKVAAEHDKRVAANERLRTQALAERGETIIEFIPQELSRFAAGSEFLSIVSGRHEPLRLRGGEGRCGERQVSCSLSLLRQPRTCRCRGAAVLDGEPYR